MSPRMQQLQKMLEREPADPFLLYGIGMEHKKALRWEDAVEFFDRTIAADSGYCYAYYQRGLVYEQQGEFALAKQSYRDGITAAKVKGDAHAESELQTALPML